MNPKFIQMLLSNVAKAGNINSLIEAGLSYKEIAELTDFAIEKGYIDVNLNQIELSKSGHAKLIELRADLRNLPKIEWISSEEKSKIVKVTKDYIFVPKIDELP